MMQIRSETIRTDTKNEDNIALAQEISKNFYGIFGTSYDGKIIFNLSVPFPSVSDDAAKQMIMQIKQIILSTWLPLIGAGICCQHTYEEKEKRWQKKRQRKIKGKN